MKKSIVEEYCEECGELLPDKCRCNDDTCENCGKEAENCSCKDLYCDDCGELILDCFCTKEDKSETNYKTAFYITLIALIVIAVIFSIFMIKRFKNKDIQ